MLAMRYAAHADRALVQECIVNPEIQFKKKEDRIEGLQIADMIANPSKWDVLKEAGEPFAMPRFTRKVCAAIQERYDCDWRTMRQWGFGKVFLSPAR